MKTFLAALLLLASPALATTNFPTSLDDDSVLFNLSNGQTYIAPFHNNPKDAIVALETKVGANGSGITTTLDYLLKNVASVDPGHRHTSATVFFLDGTVATPGVRFGNPITDTGTGFYHPSAGNISIAVSGIQAFQVTSSGVQAKITDSGGQVFNVKAFGALGDHSSTNDSTNVQAAITAAGVGGRVYFPAGYYFVQGLTVLQGQQIFGAGTCDINLTSTLPCGTTLQPFSSAGSQTVFASNTPGAADCTRTTPFTPKCADYVTFRDMLVISNGVNDIDFDLTNMSETLLERVVIMGRLASGVIGQIGVKAAAVNNGGSPTGGLEPRLMSCRVFNQTTGIKLQLGNASMIGPNNHIQSNTTGIEIDGRCTGGTCTTGGALNPCLADADCSGCGGTCSNAGTGGTGQEHDIHHNIIETNTTDIVDAGFATKISYNHIENGSGTATQLDERGRNVVIAGNSFFNNASATSIELTHAAAMPVATRVDIRDNIFDASGKYINEATASTAIEVGRNLYNGAGLKVTTVSGSGIRWIDLSEGILFANLPSFAADGSQQFCTNCTYNGTTGVCNTGGTGVASRVATRMGGNWCCQTGGALSTCQ